MICYAPRPNDAELTSKYRFLRAALAATPALSSSAPVEASDAARAAAILDYLGPCIEGPGRVLDVGGGDGRLMTPFADRGFECFLVDQVDYTRPAVRRLGDRVEDVPANLAFDVVVCSHVLEHVASPRELLKLVRDRLRAGGAVYVEVPWEIFHNNAWNPIAAEPVEHINFFTLNAVERILHGSGFSVDKTEVGWSSYEGRPLPVIRAVGIKLGTPRHTQLPEGFQLR